MPRLVVDPLAVASNWRALQRLSGRAAAGAAVKADCYGLGVATCLPALHQAGARDFFVAHAAEAAPVARHAPGTSISVLHGPISQSDLRDIKVLGVRPVINSLHQARMWRDAGGGLCDLMIDTGMNRLGIRIEELGAPVVQALQIDLLMSHLASADEDSLQNGRQLEAFRHARGAVRHARASLANSAGIALGEAYCFDVTRPGLALFGGCPRGELAGLIKPVFEIQAALIQRKGIKAGETVGYNATFTAHRDMELGIAEIGYADGFLRAWTGKGGLCWKGRHLPLVGRVSMDMVAIDLGDAPDAAEGDWLNLTYDLPRASSMTGLSQYELLTVLGRRFNHQP